MKFLKLTGILLLLGASSIRYATAQIWKPLGQGFQQIPVAVTATNDYMYFAFVDSTTAPNNNKIFGVARWNGFFWQDLSTFVSGPASYITSIEWYKDKLYVGGFFDTVFFASSKTGLLVLDGKKWLNAARRRVDDPSPFRINALKVFDGFLYAAGGFARIDTTRANGLAKYNGFKWEAVDGFQGGTYTGHATDLEIFNDSLFVGGNYTHTISNKTISVFKIKGATAIADSLSPFTFIGHLQNAKTELMAVGLGNNAERVIYSYINGGWHSRTKGFPNLNTAVFSDLEFFDDEVWACGLFNISPKNNSIIKWSDTSWLTLDEINLTGVKYLKAFKNRFFATGSFLNFGRIQLNRVAEFDNDLAIIAGRVYHDANNNCRRDVGERPLAGQVVRLFNGLVVAYTDREGIYFFVVPRSGTYPITILPKKYWSLSSCNPTLYQFTPVTNNIIFDTADFALRLDGSIEDIGIKILPNAGYKARRGITELYSLSYKNNGGKTIVQGKLKLKIDTGFKNFVAFPPPQLVTGGVAQWEFSSLDPGEEKTIIFKGKVEGASTGQIEFLADAGSVSDVFGGDNYDTLQQTVDDDTTVNGKYIFPEPEDGDSVTVFDINGGQREVEYLIRFENTTTDTVQTVVVVDTIDLNLSIEYIQELGASHPYTTQVINLPPQLGKGVLVWTFSNINLPPNLLHSNDFVENRGHIRFRIRMSDKTPAGTLVKNKADVWFDFATQHATNKVYCTMDRLQSIAVTSVGAQGITIYPNPATTQLTVVTEDDGEGKISISDMHGRACLATQYFSGGKADIDVSGLAQGIYFLSVSTGTTTTYTKFVKQ